MKKITLIILVASIVCFAGCAATGTKTLFKTDNKPYIRNIGYCDLYDKVMLSSIFPRTNDVFNIAINECILNHGFSSPLRIESVIPEDKNSISGLCENNSIDALLFTNLKFISATYSMYFIPVAKNLDTEVEMRLYDRQGNLLYSTKHNTFKGNSYMSSPSAERTVYDGVKGAWKRIAREADWSAVK